MVLLMVASATGFALKWVRLPYSVALVIVGLIIGSTHLFPKVEMTPELILFVCLPALLFEASWNIKLADLKLVWKPVGLFASVGVLISMFITGSILHFVCKLDWHSALLFGAMTAATDPISVLSLFRTLGLERRLSMTLEAESLFNDGTAVVLFKMVMVTAFIATTPFTIIGSVFEFLKVVVIGALVGLGVGLLGSRITRYFEDHLLEITLTTIVAYGSYLVAEQLKSSAVIAVVVAGIVVGHYGSRTGMSATTRLAVNSFWEYAAFVVNSLVFLLIGLQINLGLLQQHFTEILVAVGALFLARLVVVYGFCPLLSTKRLPIPVPWRHLLFWGALRGSLSMALALSLPRDFPMREQLVVLTFGVVLFTLLVPGLTIEPLVRFLGMAKEDVRLKEFAKLRSRLFAESQALDELEHQRSRGVITQSVFNKLKKEVTEKQTEVAQKIEDLRLEHSIVENVQLNDARKRLLESKKDSLFRLVREENADSDTIEDLIMEIDQELDDVASSEREIESQLILDNKANIGVDNLGGLLKISRTPIDAHIESKNQARKSSQNLEKPASESSDVIASASEGKSKDQSS